MSFGLGLVGSVPIRYNPSVEKGRHLYRPFTRKLSGGEGDLALAEGKVVPFGIAVHTDKTVYRFHHVSLGYKLGIGADGDVKAAKQ